MKDEQSKEIEDSVLDRCVSHGGVIHIYVDRRSPFVSPICQWVKRKPTLEMGKGHHSRKHSYCISGKGSLNYKLCCAGVCVSEDDRSGICSESLQGSARRLVQR